MKYKVPLADLRFHFKKLNFLLIFCLLFLEQSFAQIATDSIRIAHIQWGLKDKPIPQQFLLNAKANGYNYVLCEYLPFKSDWDTNGNITVHPSTLQKTLTQHFQQVDSMGLRLIPLLTTGNAHSAYYNSIINKNIPQQLIHQNLPGERISNYSSFVMSPEPTNSGANLMNKAFDSLWTMVFTAFNNAKSKMKDTTLDFVHIGYDENVHVWWDTIANEFKIVPLVGLCSSDTAWLKSNGLKGSSTTLQIQRLYAANIKNRVKQIISIGTKYGCATKVIIWADMFDPCLYDQRLYSFPNLFDRKLQNNDPTYRAESLLTKVNLVGSLRQTDMMSVKGNLILAPWSYNTLCPSGGPYIPKKVIDTITSIGYQVLYTCSNGSCFKFDSHGQPKFDTITNAAYKNAFEFAIAAHDSKFKSKTIGYISTSWSDIGTIDTKQGNLIWNSDSVYIKPFNFQGIMTRINYQRTSNAFR